MIGYSVLAFFLGLAIGLLVWFLTRGQGKEALSDLLRENFKENRQELSASILDSRRELNETVDRMARNVEEKLLTINQGMNQSAKEGREEVRQSLQTFQQSFSENVQAFNELQRRSFQDMGIKQDELVRSTQDKLEKMRETVDEKLHKTLEERLGQSFRLVSERLVEVQKGLGEMQSLATGVGDLKRVLSNVKTRGVLGEIQLGNILEQVLAPEQYAANVKTKKDSSNHVEYAIKMPGSDQVQQIYLPIDAKFPQEDYERLQMAYDAADREQVDASQKSLSQSIKKFARDIRDKYIDPPHTTDFGIMFLPIEGLFAEVVRQPALIEQLQREYKIIVTGPTTLAAMLNSLQMGFKTLAIQKRSSEVWDVLASVKKEFGTFGDVLQKAQKKIMDANSDLDKLVGTRTRMIQSKLKKVESLPINSPSEEEPLPLLADDTTS